MLLGSQPPETKLQRWRDKQQNTKRPKNNYTELLTLEILTLVADIQPHHIPTNGR